MNETAINELRAQRNHAFDMLANAAGAIADLKDELAKAKAEISKLKEAAEIQSPLNATPGP